MYGELYRQDILSDALDQVIANDGVPGVDGFEVETLVKNEAYRAAWLLALAEEMRTKTYRPSPVLRVYIEPVPNFRIFKKCAEVHWDCGRTRWHESPQRR
ncbi:MAG: hypothetical protein H2172_18705 [Opitutus sp.]|nr:hypothetical protein [Opitutus sp.]MCS6278699.1 hypothetical protein [Opitutus sp.]MCS6299723.1 hypothetical protein [Opitutus sp.]